jgi:hypothetical protein
MKSSIKEPGIVPSDAMEYKREQADFYGSSLLQYPFFSRNFKSLVHVIMLHIFYDY